jgi:hypothetical protein
MSWCELKCDVQGMIVMKSKQRKNPHFNAHAKCIILGTGITCYVWMDTHM